MILLNLPSLVIIHYEFSTAEGSSVFPPEIT
jgi:hypothetical protein